MTGTPPINQASALANFISTLSEVQEDSDNNGAASSCFTVQSIDEASVSKRTDSGSVGTSASISSKDRVHFQADVNGMNIAFKLMTYEEQQKLLEISTLDFYTYIFGETNFFGHHALPYAMQIIAQQIPNRVPELRDKFDIQELYPLTPYILQPLITNKDGETIDFDEAFFIDLKTAAEGSEREWENFIEASKEKFYLDHTRLITLYRIDPSLLKLTFEKLISDTIQHAILVKDGKSIYVKMKNVILILNILTDHFPRFVDAFFETNQLKRINATGIFMHRHLQPFIMQMAKKDHKAKVALGIHDVLSATTQKQADLEEVEAVFNHSILKAINDLREFPIMLFLMNYYEKGSRFYPSISDYFKAPTHHIGDEKNYPRLAFGPNLTDGIHNRRGRATDSILSTPDNDFYPLASFILKHDKNRDILNLHRNYLIEFFGNILHDYEDKYAKLICFLVENEKFMKFKNNLHQLKTQAPIDNPNYGIPTLVRQTISAFFMNNSEMLMLLNPITIEMDKMVQHYTEGPRAAKRQLALKMKAYLVRKEKQEAALKLAQARNEAAAKKATASASTATNKNRRRKKPAPKRGHNKRPTNQASTPKQQQKKTSVELESPEADAIIKGINPLAAFNGKAEADLSPSAAPTGAVSVLTPTKIQKQSLKAKARKAFQKASSAVAKKVVRTVQPAMPGLLALLKSDQRRLAFRDVKQEVESAGGHVRQNKNKRVYELPNGSVTEHPKHNDLDHVHEAAANRLKKLAAEERTSSSSPDSDSDDNG